MVFDSFCKDLNMEINFALYVVNNEWVMFCMHNNIEG